MSLHKFSLDYRVMSRDSHKLSRIRRMSNDYQQFFREAYLNPFVMYDKITSRLWMGYFKNLKTVIDDDE